MESESVDPETSQTQRCQFVEDIGGRLDKVLDSLMTILEIVSRTDGTTTKDITPSTADQRAAEDASLIDQVRTYRDSVEEISERLHAEISKTPEPLKCSMAPYTKSIAQSVFEEAIGLQQKWDQMFPPAHDDQPPPAR